MAAPRYAIAKQSLFDAAEPSTPEGDELERLAALVEEYEEKHFPI